MPERSEDTVELVATRQQPGAGPSRPGGVKATASGRPQSGRRRALQGRQQESQHQDVIDLTDDKDDDEVQITQVKQAKRRRVLNAAAFGAAPLQPAPGAVPAQAPPEAPPSPKGYKCIICLERMEADMATTHCGHMFCYKCISAWIHKSGNCPQCRTKLTKNKVIRLYPPT